MTTLTDPTIEEQLDRISLQLESVSQELQVQRANRERWSELTEVVTPIASQAMFSISGELEDMDLTLDDLARFVRTLATALPTIERALAQVSVVNELIEVLVPMAKPILDSATERTAILDERGYFDIARSGLGVVDRVVTSFTEEDVEALGDNIVLILQTVREMTQPEVMQMFQRTFTTVQKSEHADIAEPPGAFALLRQMRSPDVRRGLNKALGMLRSLGEEAVATATEPPTNNNNNRR